MEARLQFQQQFDVSLSESIWMQVCTHKSRLGLVSNERLEFLGDAVVQLAISEFLFAEESGKSLSEGDMTKWRAALVNQTTLALAFRGLNIHFEFLMGATEKSSGLLEQSDRFCASVFESLVGAISVECGFDKAKSFVERTVWPLKQWGRDHLLGDYKSKLQEWTQKKGIGTPNYQTQSLDTGFVSTLSFRQEIDSTFQGTGKTKKEAEQDAALKALLVFSNRGGEKRI